MKKFLKIFVCCGLFTIVGNNGYGMGLFKSVSKPSESRLLEEQERPTMFTSIPTQQDLELIMKNDLVNDLKNYIKKNDLKVNDSVEIEGESNPLLLWAAWYNAIKIMTHLIKKEGAYVNSKDRFGNTALHVVTRADCANLLIQYNAEINAQNEEKNTPLHIAAGIREVDIVQVLLDKKAKTDIENDEKQTPLQKAILAAKETLYSFRSRLEVKLSDVSRLQFKKRNNIKQNFLKSLADQINGYVRGINEFTKRDLVTKEDIKLAEEWLNYFQNSEKEEAIRTLFQKIYVAVKGNESSK